MLDKTDRLTDRQMKGQPEIADMPKFNNNILENSQTLAKWLETNKIRKGGTISLIILVFNPNDTVFL